MIVLQVIGYHGTHTVEYRIARSYGDVYYVVAGVLWKMVGDDGGCGVGAGAGRRWSTGTAVMSVRVLLSSV